jgi:RNA polymerase sigma-70 factor (family 1)
MRNIDLIQADDAQLLISVQQGNKEAFNLLYRKYWNTTYAQAYKRLKDEEHSKDIVQEIFVHIWLNRETVIENLPAYLNIAVRNRVFKLAEKQKRMCYFLELLQDIPAKYQEADANIQFREFYAAYEALLSTLPPKRQIIFKLRFHEGLSTADIAERMGISRKTVQNQLGKAVDYVRMGILPASAYLFLELLN